ncbi:MAG: RDD family protein [Gammaproteobacteria bacterium]|jgi:uncharacterized RDD family membrane protein YckC
MIDTRRTIQTPEGVELGLRVAGPAPRAYAWLIDFLIRVAIYTVLSIVLSIFGHTGIGILLIMMFLLEWFYPVVFEVYRQGATPGKRSLGIKAMNDDGTEVSWQSSLIRNLLRAVDFLPFMYGFGVVTMLFNQDFKRLGDLAAGTIVVYQDKVMQAAEIPQESPKSPPVPFTAAEQRAMIQFAERIPLLTSERCNELANILQGVTRMKNEMAVKRIVQYANWMLGRR